MSRLFIFNCPQCGEYSVTESEFFAIFSDDVLQRLRTLLKSENCAGAQIDFQTLCNRCEHPFVNWKGRVSILSKVLTHS